MKKWNMIVDVALCENCTNCVLATKDEHVGNDFPGYAAPQPLHGHRWIDVKRKVRGSGSMVDAAYLPTMCNHCDDAPCLKVGAGVVTKREDGIVIIDPQKAKGRRDLVDACPYGAIWWNEELQLPQHWIFDAHLLDQGWRQPRSSQVCPTNALRAVKVEDAEMRRIVDQERLEVLKPELETRPRVYYKNLHRFSKCFVAGSVIATVDGVTECVGGAEVELCVADRKIARQETDEFGDFKFDSIEPYSGAYTVIIDHPKFGRAQIDVEVAADSVYAEQILIG